MGLAVDEVSLIYCVFVPSCLYDWGVYPFTHVCAVCWWGCASTRTNLKPTWSSSASAYCTVSSDHGCCVADFWWIALLAQRATDSLFRQLSPSKTATDLITECSPSLSHLMFCVWQSVGQLLNALKQVPQALSWNVTDFTERGNNRGRGKMLITSHQTGAAAGLQAIW